MWGFNSVWSGNTSLWSDQLATNPMRPGYYNYNGVVLQVLFGGSVAPNPPYECPAFALLAEDGDFLQAENSDYIDIEHT